MTNGHIVLMYLQGPEELRRIDATDTVAQVVEFRADSNSGEPGYDIVNWKCILPGWVVTAQC